MKTVANTKIWSCVRFSPEWIFLCAVRLDFDEKFFPQCSQTCLASPECMCSTCDSMELRCANSLGQKEQWNGLCVVCSDEDGTGDGDALRGAGDGDRLCCCWMAAAAAAECEEKKKGKVRYFGF